MFAAFLAAMVLIAVAFTGCGKDSDNKGGGGANSVEWDPAKTVHPDHEMWKDCPLFPFLP